jgi:hypothetical protein
MAIELTLESLAGGGAVARLHKVLQEALDNIIDPNTPAKKVRKVNLEMLIKPNSERTHGEVLITASCSLPPASPLETSILIDRTRQGKAVAKELAMGEIPGSAPLPGMEDDAQNGKIAKLSHKTKEA